MTSIQRFVSVHAMTDAEFCEWNAAQCAPRCAPRLSDECDLQAAQALALARWHDRDFPRWID